MGTVRTLGLNLLLFERLVVKKIYMYFFQHVGVCRMNPENDLVQFRFYIVRKRG